MTTERSCTPGEAEEAADFSEPTHLCSLCERAMSRSRISDSEMRSQESMWKLELETFVSITLKDMLVEGGFFFLHP